MANIQLSSSDSCSKTNNEINKRIYDRNLPSQFLQPYLSVRPVMTKYSFMPIVDPRAPINVPLVQQPVYNVHNVFNPGNTQSPWSGFASNINKESMLRNQVFALQECSQSVYVPSSNSDLYKFSFKPEKNVNQPFPNLFHNERFSEFDPNPENVAHGTFMNHTRQQLKDIIFDECGYAVTLPEQKNQEQIQGQQGKDQSINQRKNIIQQNQTMAQINNKLYR
jgi:hypothetical protein